MLLDAATRAAIIEGRVDLVFRRWARPTVRTGGSLRTAGVVLDIVDVRAIDEREITDADAVRAGFPDAAAVVQALSTRPGTAYRIEVRPAGPDPRIELRGQDRLSAEELEQVLARLARLDRSSSIGPWTEATLATIERQPATRAADLAAQLGRERDPFKVDVRKLKQLGLTISLETGYELSPRGRVILAALRGASIDG
jgi:hypothetical protein